MTKKTAEDLRDEGILKASIRQVGVVATQLRLREHELDDLAAQVPAVAAAMMAAGETIPSDNVDASVLRPRRAGLKRA